MPQGNPEGYIEAVPSAQTKAGPNPMSGPRPGATDANGDGQMSDVEQRFRDLPPDMRQLFIASITPEVGTIMMMLMPDLAPLISRAMSASPDMVQGVPMTPGAGPAAMAGPPGGAPAPMPGAGGGIGAITA